MTENYRRIGIIKPCCIGDAAMALPVIDNIRYASPATDIEVWCGCHAQAVFEAHPGVGAIANMSSVPSLRRLPGLIWRLRQSSVDGFLLLDASRLLSIACRAAGVTVLGAVRSTSPEIEHETDRYLDTLDQAGLPCSFRQPSLKIDTLASRRVSERIGIADHPYVVLHPGGAMNPGAAMPSKRWPSAGWREVISWLAGRSIRVVLTGSLDETALCEELAVDTSVIVAAGKLTLMESAALTAGAVAYVGPDTGLSHLAAATGTPSIVIFGPTNPRHYAPRGRSVTILAAPGSEELPRADLRKRQLDPLPSTADVPPSAVIETLERYLECSEVEGW